MGDAFTQSISGHLLCPLFSLYLPTPFFPPPHAGIPKNGACESRLTGFFNETLPIFVDSDYNRSAKRLLFR